MVEYNMAWKNNPNATKITTESRRRGTHPSMEIQEMEGIKKKTEEFFAPKKLIQEPKYQQPEMAHNIITMH
jgi:hypothetical protein